MATQVHRLHAAFEYAERGSGRAQAVATAAYQDRSEYVDQRSGMTFGYAKDTPPITSEIIAPDQFQQLGDSLTDPEKFWNSYEEAETLALAARYRNNPAKALDKIEQAHIGVKGHFTLSQHLSADQQIHITREILRHAVVQELGTVCHFAIHNDAGNPHVHFLFTRRTVNEKGDFGRQVFRQYSEPRLWAERFRETIAGMQNSYMQELGIDHHVEHLSNAELGIDLTPLTHESHAEIGASLSGEPIGKASHNEAVRRENAEKVLTDPTQIIRLLLIAHRDKFDPSREIQEGILCRDNATFTRADVERQVRKITGGRDDLVEAITEAVLTHKDTVALASDGRGDMRFTTKAYFHREQSLIASGRTLQQSQRFSVDTDFREKLISEKYSYFNDGQKAALRHMTEATGIALVQGRAGVGKTTIMQAAREIWENEGYKVRGCAIAWKAAKGLEKEAGIKSASIASIALAHETGLRPELKLQKGEILVVDETGMVDVRSMEILTRAAAEVGAKIVAIGDTAQFAAIGAGASFALLQDELGAHEISQIMRQSADAEDILVHSGMNRDQAMQRASEMTFEERRTFIAENQKTAKEINFCTNDVWRRHAARDLADGKTAEAILQWEKRGFVRSADSHDEMIGDIVKNYFDLRDHGERDQSIYAFTNADTNELNRQVRAELIKRGEVQAKGTHIGRREFSIGDQIAFTANDIRGDRVQAEGGILNGDTGKITDIERGTYIYKEWQNRQQVERKAETDIITVMLTDGRTARFGVNAWTDINHAYAMTHYKSQGATIGDNTQGTVHILADKYLRADGVYVALTRSKQDTVIYHSREEFSTFTDLSKSLSRAPEKHNIADIQRGAGVIAERIAVVATAGRKISELIEAEQTRQSEQPEQKQTVIRGESGLDGEDITDEIDADIEPEIAQAGISAEERQRLSPTALQKIGEIVRDRTQAAREIILDTANRPAAMAVARAAGISWSRIEELAGIRQPVRTDTEIRAEAKAITYAEKANEARKLLAEMRQTHGVSGIKQHPRYEEYSQARNARDALATDIMAERHLYKKVFANLVQPARLVTMDEIKNDIAVRGQQVRPSVEISWTAAQQHARQQVKREAQRVEAESLRQAGVKIPAAGYQRQATRDRAAEIEKHFTPIYARRMARLAATEFGGKLEPLIAAPAEKLAQFRLQRMRGDNGKIYVTGTEPDLKNMRVPLGKMIEPTRAEVAAMRKAEDAQATVNREKNPALVLPATAVKKPTVIDKTKEPEPRLSRSVKI